MNASTSPVPGNAGTAWTARTTTTNLRSRGGCGECRRVHRKCDERRPSCGRCVATRKACSYHKPLSWGGRPFAKSSFGVLAANEAVSATPAEWEDSSVPESRRSFVYSATAFSTGAEHAADAGVSNRSSTAGTASGSSPVSLAAIVQPDVLCQLSEGDRSLIHHFAYHLTPCFSLSPTQHDKFCRTFLPLALDRTYGGAVLSAIVLCTTIHRASPGSDAAQRAQLYLKCIRELQQVLRHPAPIRGDVAAAACLVLCLADILAGGQDFGAWKLHLNGAAASLDAVQSDAVATQRSLSETTSFLWRWCRSLRTVGFSTANPDQSNFVMDTGSNGEPSKPFHYIDVFDGFSTDLVPIFRDINDMAVEMRAIRTLELQSSGSADSHCIWDLRCMLLRRGQRLVSQLENMAKAPVNKLDPSLPQSVRDEHGAEFRLLNKACHHTALLEIYQRVLNKSPSDPEVQNQVEAGIKCLKSLNLTKGSTPGVASLHPVFIIGCSATTASDRMFIMDWLGNMRQLYRMGNVPSAKLFLFELWQHNDALKSAEDYAQWHDFMLQKNMDLSLY
ncbi:hypothetical protein TGAM01_v201905 [Trichoderma gamsii]|uniref:Zn(2)-C6 fungal-type domain-containing protein n=1 Tax=Trichoderma gamsii TaxID=398673 RepID=A0A2P4ZWX4_9HYPO|nr:hypothetical protein TGAM01_v201905 [Trichoderma gamsii]PON28797.1 hypothetical protein TGAM01_v201905 [Trichoderma gamsii]